MTSNDDILAQLQGQAADTGFTDDNALEMLNQQPLPDPLADVDYTGDLEEDSRREFSALEQGFRDRAKREADRFRLATDSEYWFCVCFKTREDKDRFLHAMKLWAIGDKYLDGYAVARALGIPMDEETGGGETR